MSYTNGLNNNKINLALFEPDIPQNTGSLIRLSACLGVALHIIGPTGYPADDRRMRRVALDYGAQADMIIHTSWPRFREYRHAHAPMRLVLLTTRSEHAYTDFAFAPGDVLLLGRESSGVPQAVRDEADAAVTIALQPGARSLNVAMAASMVLGEALRQMKGKT